MKAFQILPHKTIALQETISPTPKSKEILIQIQGTALNRADLLQIEGKYPPPLGAPKDIPGLEYVGLVSEQGESASRFPIGTQVYGIAPGGTYAEYICMHEDEVSLAPKGLSVPELAAIPEAYLTAYDALLQAQVALGETVLIHAAASGVGTALLQLTKAMGATPLGSVRSKTKATRLCALGFPNILVSEEGSFASQVKEFCLTHGLREPSVVIDLVGGSYVEESLSCLSAMGRMILVGLTGGSRVDLSLGLLLQKRITLKGTVMRSRSHAEKILLHQTLSRLAPLFEQGILKPIIDSVYKFEDAPRALERLASNQNLGKILLEFTKHST